MKRQLDDNTLDFMVDTLSRKKARTVKSSRRSRKMAKTVKAMVLSREPKYVDTALNVLSVTITPQVFSLNDVAQGDNYTNRQGNVIQSKYLQYRFSCNLTNQAIVQASNFKMAIVLDRQPNGTPPTFAQAFDTSVSTLAFAMKNLAQFQERFVILAETIGVATSNTGGDASQSCFKGYIDLSKLKVQDQIVRYNGTTANSPNTNGLYLMIVSTSTVAGDCRFLGTYRYVFNEQ